VDHLGRELVIVLGRLAGGKLDALLAAPTAAARERIQPAEHGLGGAQMLRDVQASTRGGAGWALGADRSGNHQHSNQEHKENEAAATDRQEDRKMPTPAPAEATAPTAKATAPTAETSAAAAAAGQRGRRVG
jgi:hypothetical protein